MFVQASSYLTMLATTQLSNNTDKCEAYTHTVCSKGPKDENVLAHTQTKTHTYITNAFCLLKVLVYFCTVYLNLSLNVLVSTVTF